MIKLIFYAISLVVGVRCEVYKGSYRTQQGDEIQYHMGNSDHYAALILDMMNDLSNDPMVNVTYYKNNGRIKFHILGNDHFDSTEEDFEKEAELTKELMETGLGKHLPSLSKHMYDKYSVTGKENEGMMLLNLLALSSHVFHDGAHTPIATRRQKRSILSGETESNEVGSVFPESVVQCCNSELISSHGGCTVDLAVVGTNNICKKKNKSDLVEKGLRSRKFTKDDITKGCYGLCGPWCSCWVQVCGDCCWHPGCDQHDRYCDKPSSLACKLGKGVVYGRKGLPTC